MAGQPHGTRLPDGCACSIRARDKDSSLAGAPSAMLSGGPHCKQHTTTTNSPVICSWHIAVACNYSHQTGMQAPQQQVHQLANFIRKDGWLASFAPGQNKPPAALACTALLLTNFTALRSPNLHRIWGAIGERSKRQACWCHTKCAEQVWSWLPRWVLVCSTANHTVMSPGIRGLYSPTACLVTKKHCQASDAPADQQESNQHAHVQQIPALSAYTQETTQQQDGVDTIR